MKKVYLLPQNHKTTKIFNDTHRELSAMLKALNPGTKDNAIVNNPELSSLHDLWVLLRSKKIRTWEGEDDNGNRFLALEVKTFCES